MPWMAPTASPSLSMRSSSIVLPLTIGALIKVKHPDPACNQKQEEMLGHLPEGQKRFMELSFCHGNAAYRYHQSAQGYEPDEQDWREWLEGLPANFRLHMEKEGFEKNKRVLSFTRYVNEKNDVGMDEYIRQWMGDQDYEEYMAHIRK
jgi:hypothetical protein